MAKKNECIKCCDRASDYTVFDLETTGFYARHGEISQIGAIKIGNRQPVCQVYVMFKTETKPNITKNDSNYWYNK